MRTLPTIKIGHTMNKTKIVKFATSVVTGAGTSHVIDGIIKTNVNFDDLNSFGKVQVAAARVVIGMMASAKTKEFTDAKIDALVANWNDKSENIHTITDL